MALTMNEKKQYLKVLTQNVAILVTEKYETEIPTEQSLNDIREAVNKIAQELPLLERADKGEAYPLTVSFVQILKWAYGVTDQDARDYLFEMLKSKEAA
jgi:hypothetical protein